MRTSPLSRFKRTAAGFSLFEVLVVLVIVGIVSAISMSMVSQLRRTLDRFFPAAEHYARFEVRTNLLSSVIVGIVPSRAVASRFSGNEAAFAGLSTNFPTAAWAGEQLTRMTIATNNGQTAIIGEKLALDGTIIGSIELLRIECTRARFYYLTADLTWTNQWKQQSQFPFTPLAIRFSCEDPLRALHLITPIEREGESIMTDVHMLQVNR